MRFLHLVLLVAFVLASLDIASASKNSKLTALRDPTHVLESNIPTKRFMRAYTTNEGVDEERGISIKLPSLEQISNTFKSSKTNGLQGLLKGDESIGDAFKKLKLSTMRIGDPKTQFIETEDVVKLFSSTNFKLWSKHVTKVNKKNPEAAMLTALTNVFGEKDVAIMILLSKDSWRAGSIVKKLEKAQFNKWFNEGKRPDDVLKKLFGVKFVNIHRHPRPKQIWEAYEKYSTKRVANY